ncbi:ankyrin repeat protein [Elusimicrobium simillimum]|uniref:ankyrin repeat domain-containing protein n=1 Tax=Elusimicrobium simillimum TaxID=3143438 RepID=UPI003C6FF535
MKKLISIFFALVITPIVFASDTYDWESTPLTYQSFAKYCNETQSAYQYVFNGYMNENGKEVPMYDLEGIINTIKILDEDNKEKKTILETALLKKDITTMKCLSGASSTINLTPILSNGKATLDYVFESKDKELIKIYHTLGYYNPKHETLKEPFITAIKDKNKPEFEKLLAQGADIEFPVYHKDTGSCPYDMLRANYTALSDAVQNGDKAWAKYLISKGADKVIGTKSWRTKIDANCSYWTVNISPIYTAIQNNNLEMLRILVDKDNVNTPLYHGVKDYKLSVFTPLAIAVQENNKVAAEYLVSVGADVNGSSQKEFEREIIQPIKMAVMTDNLEMVKFLGELGAHDSATCSGYDSGGFECSSTLDTGNVEIIRYLISKGFKPNDREDLFSAVRRGNVEIVDMFIKAGADIKARYCDDGGCYILILSAVEDGNIKMLQFLVDSGAEVYYEHDEVFEGVWGQPICRVFYRDNSIDKTRREILKILIKNGANLTPKCYSNTANDSEQTITSFFLEKYPQEKEIIDLLKSKNAPE